MRYIFCTFVTHRVRCLIRTELISRADASIQGKANTEEESSTATDTSDR